MGNLFDDSKGLRVAFQYTFLLLFFDPNNYISQKALEEVTVTYLEIVAHKYLPT